MIQEIMGQIRKHDFLEGEILLEVLLLSGPDLGGEVTKIQTRG